MSNYAIFRTKKIKHLSQLQAAENHITRKEEKRFNIDYSKTEENDLDLPQPMIDFYKRRLADTGKKERKNGVKMVEVVLTASPDFFENFEDEDQFGEWVLTTKNWVKEKFGEENIAGFALHMDESTPHIHAFFTPVVDNKFNCRAILGGAPKLSKLQDSYAEAVADFGLTRGKPKIDTGVENKPLADFWRNRKENEQSYNERVRNLNFKLKQVEEKERKNKEKAKELLDQANNLLNEASMKLSDIEDLAERQYQQEQILELRMNSKKIRDDFDLNM